MTRGAGRGPGEPGVRGLTIGEAVARLAGQFPGFGAETLRAMERHGLLAPRRTPAGYRRYSERDLETVRGILAGVLPPRAEPAAGPLREPGRTPGHEPPPRRPGPPAPVGPSAGARGAARPHLPERARAYPDPASEPSAPAEAQVPRTARAHAESGAAAAPRAHAEPRAAVPPDSGFSGASGTNHPDSPPPLPAGAESGPARRRSPRWPEPEYFTPELGEVAFGRPGLARAAGLDEHRVAELAGFGLISGADPATGADLLVAKAAADLLEHGIEPRHLRPVAVAAGRAAAMLKAAGSGSSGAGSAHAAAALVRLEAALLRAALLDD